MQYLEGGELKKFVQDQHPIEEDECMRIFNQILAAVEYFHSKKIVHRDLKLENIVFESNESNHIRVSPPIQI